MNTLMLENEEVRKVINNYENEIKKLKEERKRFLVIAYNAIDYMIGVADMSVEQICEYICCTKEEYDEIMEI